MKKLLFIPLALILFACPSEDDTPPPTAAQDQIIGTWKHSARLIDNQAQPLEPCDTEQTLIFEENNDVTAILFGENNIGDCIIEIEDTGTWENMGNSNYLINIDGGAEIEEIFFEANTFYLQYIVDLGTPDDTTDDITVKIIYTKQ